MPSLCRRPVSMPAAPALTICLSACAADRPAASAASPCVSVATQPAMSAMREREGYTIVANVGDQPSDLERDHAPRAFLPPNPFCCVSCSRNAPSSQCPPPRPIGSRRGVPLGRAIDVGRFRRMSLA